VAVLDALSDGELGDILTKVTEMRTGLSPKKFQLKAAIAAWRNRDTLLIAGTGSGKTLSFVMGCFLSRKVVVVIISPLNILQDDQVSQIRSKPFTNVLHFCRLGAFVNGDFRQQQSMHRLSRTTSASYGLANASTYTRTSDLSSGYQQWPLSGHYHLA
jgi:ATP-dependent helicase YprA (DUF1998 family)